MTGTEPNLTEASTTPTAPLPPQPEPLAQPGPPAAGTVHLGTGRRKTSVARIRLVPGDGKFLVNKRPLEAYFPLLRNQQDVAAPLEMAGARRHWDVLAIVHGGGSTGQAGAVRLGLARAVVKAYGQHEQALRDAGFLTRDAREVERKKYGRRKARRRFQFSKR